jgi:hypothetical protein
MHGIFVAGQGHDQPDRLQPGHQFAPGSFQPRRCFAATSGDEFGFADVKAGRCIPRAQRRLRAAQGDNPRPETGLLGICSRIEIHACLQVHQVRE